MSFNRLARRKLRLSVDLFSARRAYLSKFCKATGLGSILRAILQKAVSQTGIQLGRLRMWSSLLLLRAHQDIGIAGGIAIGSCGT